MRNHAYYDVGVTIRQTGRSKDCPKNFLVFVIKIGDNIALNGDFNIHEHTSVYAVPPEELIPIDKGAKHSLRFSVQQFFFFFNQCLLFSPGFHLGFTQGNFSPSYASQRTRPVLSLWGEFLVTASNLRSRVNFARWAPNCGILGLWHLCFCFCFFVTETLKESYWLTFWKFSFEQFQN